MKFFITFFIAFSTSFSLFASNDDNTLKAEESAIVEVILKETQAYCLKDFDTWKACWAHEEYVNWTGVADDHSFVIQGWEELATSFQKYFETHPTPLDQAIKTQDIQVRINGETAFVTFTMDAPYESKETRVLEKKDGEWKIIHLSVVSE